MRNLSFIILSTAAVFSACGNNAEVPPEVVATVGDQRITYRQLEESFVLDPRYAIRTPLAAARRSQLDHLVEQEYHYLAAAGSGLEQDSSVLEKLRYIERQEVLKAFVREQFLDTVRIAPDDVITGIQRFSRMLRVKNIFRKDRDDIQEIYRQLRQHRSSAADIFNAIGVDLGWITFGMIEPELEEAAYRLEAGRFSDIIATDGGYHILLVEESRTNPDHQQAGPAMHMEQVKEALRKRRAHNGILEFLKTRAGTQKIQINNRVAGKLAAAIDESTGSPEDDPTILQPPISGDEIDMIDLDLMTVSHEPIARFGEAGLTVGDFLERLREMPPYHRPYIKGRARLVQVLLDMMRNDMLTNAAVEQGYPLRTSVRNAIDRYGRELLADEFSKRYNSAGFREMYPEEWADLDRALREVKENLPAETYPAHLVAEGEDPDSILTDAPIPVFLKSRYMW